MRIDTVEVAIHIVLLLCGGVVGYLLRDLIDDIREGNE